MLLSGVTQNGGQTFFGMNIATEAEFVVFIS